ncbi:omega-hydroxypalmitate O-feruloyl transferase-like [Rhodamnia argentea]|uniref:Omega-hydroxypalmitate O-feruloyl transferase-like n=1 Tax=Rhodamnia argentea TaxID=178133 RepID=A0ABM3HUL2_9MYRT|nr:omega-hydroxypalmitate O-feruloyl transferase-like [Rhodamnia argentea]
MEAFQTATNRAPIVERSVPVAIPPELETPGGSLFLSNLDQLFVALVPVVYFFDRSAASTVDVIKRALSKVLVPYFPVAGRLAKNSQGKFTVDCAKKLGVPFVEAWANFDVKHLGDMQLIDPDVSRKLIYTDPIETKLEDAPLLTAQVTKFRCGGFTIGILCNHRIFDGVSAMNFMNSWAEIARGKPVSIIPSHERTLLKSRVPPQITAAYEVFVPVSDVSNLTGLYKEEQNVQRSFHFNGEKLAILKKMATADGRVTSSISSFIALAALPWRARSMASKMKQHQPSKLFFAVDRRAMLKVPKHFGNATAGACLSRLRGELINQPISSTAERIKKATERVDEEYVRSWIDSFEMYGMDAFSLSLLVLTSWQRLDYGSTDFGWGNPRQFGCGPLLENTCVVLPKGSGRKGLVLMLSLPFSAMNTFEKLLQFSTCEPETPSLRSRARM